MCRALGSARVATAAEEEGRTESEGTEARVAGNRGRAARGLAAATAVALATLRKRITVGPVADVRAVCADFEGLLRRVRIARHDRDVGARRAVGVGRVGD